MIKLFFWFIGLCALTSFLIAGFIAYYELKDSDINEPF